MLDLRYVAEHLEEVSGRLRRRGFTDKVVLERLASEAARRKDLISKVESLRAVRNDVSRAMGKFADKKSPEFAQKRTEMKDVNDRIKALEQEHRTVEESIEELLLSLPNMPHESAPDGLDEEGNVELRVVGEKPSFDFKPKEHDEIGTALGILDFERGAKISGARMTVLKGLGARLERALMSFMLDLHGEEHGYTEAWPPALVRDSALRGTGQLPKFGDDLFQIARQEGWQQHQEESGYDLYLSPTAEVQLTNLHAGEILDGQALPQGYCAFAPCFRAEAGSYGRDVRGLIRQHQFDKVELVWFCRPDQGMSQLDRLVSHAEEVLKCLELHYRVVELCAGDMSVAAQKAFDLEVWLPGQNAFREISSCSWCGDFQARRAKVRFRSEPKGKPQLCHTLNGSGLALGRTLLAILEQYQQADGSVVVPKVLRPYMRVNRITG
ncbi:MAG: serine--tRNA ligase [Myxococcota bacterium]